MRVFPLGSASASLGELVAVLHDLLPAGVAAGIAFGYGWDRVLVLFGFLGLVDSSANIRRLWALVHDRQEIINHSAGGFRCFGTAQGEDKLLDRTGFLRKERKTGKPFDL